MNMLHLAKGKTQVVKASTNAIFRGLIFHIVDEELFSFHSMLESATKVH